jgi:hypothetical protein
MRLESPNQYLKKWGEKQQPMLGFSSFKTRAWVFQEASFTFLFQGSILTTLLVHFGLRVEKTAR